MGYGGILIRDKEYYPLGHPFPCVLQCANVVPKGHHMATVLCTALVVTVPGDKASSLVAARSDQRAWCGCTRRSYEG